MKILLTDVFQPLKLHDKQFQVFSAATEDDLKELWSELESVNESPEYGGQYHKKCLESHPKLTFSVIVVKYSTIPLQSRSVVYHLVLFVSLCAWQERCLKNCHIFQTLSLAKKAIIIVLLKCMGHQRQKSTDQAFKLEKVDNKLYPLLPAYNMLRMPAA